MKKKVSLCLNYFLRCVSRCHNITNECILSLNKESKEKVKRKTNEKVWMFFYWALFPKRISNGLYIMVVIQPSSYMYQIKKKCYRKSEITSFCFAVKSFIFKKKLRVFFLEFELIHIMIVLKLLGFSKAINHYEFKNVKMCITQTL